MAKNLIWCLVFLSIIPVVLGLQINSSTEIYSFNVTNCQTNVSTASCDPLDIRFSCDISNYNYIDYTTFRIAGVDYVSTQNLNNFYYDWHKGYTTNTTHSTINFQRGEVTDISTGKAYFYPTNTVSLDCVTCSRTSIIGSCDINDSRFVEYIGNEAENCSSFNTTESCDYCTPAWHITSTCGSNGTELRTYSDTNNCYSTTGLYSDNCDNTFADCNDEIACTQDEGLTCKYDTHPLINIAGNKIYWYCSLSNASQTYSCLSYVKEDGFVTQTNPQQQSYSSGLVPFSQETK
jgi:hypothetical protein